MTTPYIYIYTLYINISKNLYIQLYINLYIYIYKSIFPTIYQSDKHIPIYTYLYNDFADTSPLYRHTCLSVKQQNSSKVSQLLPLLSLLGTSGEEVRRNILNSLDVMNMYVVT